MPTENFNAQWVARVKAPTSGREEWWDEKLAGLGLRVSESGKKVWVVRYRTNGKRERYTLGEFPAVTLADAREQATEILLRVKRGAMPSNERKAEKEAPTFDELADEYLVKYAKALRSDGRPQKLTWAEDERSINKDLRPTWGHRKAKDITRRDVAAVLDAIKGREAHVLANRALALISKMFNFGIDRGIVESNPAHRMKRVTEEVARDRVLSEDEIRKLWPAIEALALRADGKGNGKTPEGTRLAAMFKIRLLTAQRGGEVSLMRWEDVDLERRVWTIPAEFTKTKENNHAVPLSSQVIAIITALTDKREGWVFPSSRPRPSRKTGAMPEHPKPITNIRKAAERLVTATGIDFTPHDLRRTAATMMTGMGVPRLVVSKVLNHAEGGTTWKYDRNPYEAEKRDALDRWAACVEGILANKPPKIRNIASKREKQKTAKA